ncbi:F0F1 ATP synthase subunit epsilon [candidate division KSB1 bacterium]|nr:F0F1 ATP synthase subunit epsilon [candidate division KSB1 bacterium]
MKLKVLLPRKVLLTEDVQKVVAEAENGAFGLLPRHIDLTAALVPGILSFVTANGEEKFLAVDEGILVKCGSEVLVSVSNALSGANLGELQERLEQEFKVLDEHEKESRSALARLEAGFIRRFIEQE